LAERVDQACDAFEADWRAGGAPRIEGSLIDVPHGEHAAFLGELLAMELELRRAGGDVPRPEDYCARFPDHAALIDDIFAASSPVLPDGAAPAGITTQGPGDDSALTALLAYRLGLVSCADLVESMRAWDPDRDRSLVQVLVDRGLLKTDAVDRLMTATAAYRDRSASDADETALFVGDETDSGQVRPVRGDSTSAGGRFRVLRLHEKGGLGAVFVARDNELNRDVALKEIQPRFADDPQHRARFQFEAEITGRLEHPGVVPVYGLGSDAGGRPYYAMRLIRGDSLREAIACFHADERLLHDPGARGLELRKLLRRFLDVCNTVDYAHNRGVLHRDLKPGNIMVGRYGETLVVDWGMAKATGRREAGPGPEEPTLLPAAASVTAETLPGSALGTPAYMSPEQAAGDLERLGSRSDVYSLGATLYALLTGRAPFEGNDAREVLRAVLRGEFRLPRVLVPHVDRRLESICLKAMALHPEDRYDSPRALADDVERWTADEPVLAYPESTVDRLSRWMRRHRSWMRAVAAALVAITAVSVLATVAVDQARRRESRARVAEGIALAQATTQRDLAEENFQMALQAVDDYLTRVSEDTLLKSQDRQDLRGLRKRLLEDALVYYQRFILQRGEDPRRRTELANAYSRVSLITAEIGSKTDALDAQKQALDLARALVREDPASIERRARLATALNEAGALRRKLGLMDAARKDVIEARDLLEAIVGVRQDPSFRYQLAGAYNRLATVQDETGAPAAALGSYRNALRVAETLASDRSGDIKHRALLAMVVNNIGLAQEEIGEDKEALASYRRAGTLFSQLARDAADNPMWRNQLGCAHNDSGKLVARLEGPKAGLAELRTALDIHAEVARAHPSVSQFQDDLARTLMNVGELERQRNDRPAALRAMSQCLDIREALARANPADFWNQNQLAETHLNIGFALYSFKALVDADRSFRRAMELQARLVQRNPDKPKLARTLAQIKYELALSLIAQGRPDEAIDLLGEALQLHQSGFAKVPQIGSYRSDLADDHLALAEAYRAAGRRGDAVAQARLSLGMADAEQTVRATALLIDLNFPADPFAR
jgi:serine/threonine-protein kinase